eukprot:Colp12_sorted_trinity150504_noHs@1896
MQTLSKVCCARGAHLNDGLEALLNIARELSADGLLDALAEQLLVLLSHESKVVEGAETEDAVEGRLVSAPALGGSVQVPGVLLSLHGVGQLVLLPVRLDQGDQQALEVAGGLAGKVLLKVTTVHSLVGKSGSLDLCICARAQDFDQGTLVCAHTLHCVTQAEGIELIGGCHQCNNGILQVARKFALEVLDQILAVCCLEADLDLLSLLVGAVGKDIDNGLLVSTNTLHSLAKNCSISLKVERLGRDNGGAGNTAVLCAGGCRWGCRTGRSSCIACRRRLASGRRSTITSRGSLARRCVVTRWSAGGRCTSRSIITCRGGLSGRSLAVSLRRSLSSGGGAIRLLALRRGTIRLLALRRCTVRLLALGRCAVRLLALGRGAIRLLPGRRCAIRLLALGRGPVGLSGRGSAIRLLALRRGTIRLLALRRCTVRLLALGRCAVRLLALGRGAIRLLPGRRCAIRLLALGRGPVGLSGRGSAIRLLAL